MYTEKVIDNKSPTVQSQYWKESKMTNHILFPKLSQAEKSHFSEI